MPNTNMDLSKKDTNPDGPQLEFTLPMAEVNERVEVGEYGSVIIPVEVTQVSEGMISFRKSGKASSQAGFTKATVEQMREKLPKAER